MSFLRRLKERRNRSLQNGGPAAVQEVQGQGQEGPLGGFQPGGRAAEGTVDLGQAQGSWGQARGRSRLSKSTRVSSRSRSYST